MQLNSLNDRVGKIKKNEEDINKFIEEYKPFIASCTEKITGRYVRYGEDDELSIAMMAFTEAVKSYNFLKGNFLSFAQNVIRRRLTDYFRKESKHSSTVYLNEYVNEGEDEESYLEEKHAVMTYTDAERALNLRQELLQLKSELSDWEISFDDLLSISPKHDRTRKVYADIVHFLVANVEISKKMKEKKQLPIAEIEKSLGIPRKTIERARKYIIAVTIIAMGDYQYISEYIKGGERS